MNRTILASLIIMLCLPAGMCVSAPEPKPGIEVRTVEVKVPVAVACVKAENIPTEPERIGNKLTGDARRDLDTVAANAIRLRNWGRIMVAMLGGCVKP